MKQDVRARLGGFAGRLEEITLENLRLLVRRFRANPQSPFIDTKLNLITGRDFAEDGSRLTIRHRDVVYSWVQGRGLEALARHLGWLCVRDDIHDADILCEGIREILKSVAFCMEQIRAQNHGRVSFMVSRDGVPLGVTDDGFAEPLPEVSPQANFSDIFYAKGLFAAGQALGRKTFADAGAEYLAATVDKVLAGEFWSDQQPMDPKNSVVPESGKTGHGPLMISLGGATLMLKAGVPGWRERSEKLVGHILDRHINTGQWDGLQPYDFVEFIDPAGAPWNSGGAVLCDPGHSLEFVGLSCKVLLAARAGGYPLLDLERRCEDVLPKVLEHVFAYGFNREAQGLCKAFDLLSRKAVNSDMPWWSLPETFRAVALVLELFPDCDADSLCGIFADCAHALEGYVSPVAGLMCVQTRDATGAAVDVIPAVPDADPCYHTGLSLLDALEVLQC